MLHNVLKPCFPMIGLDVHNQISVTPPFNPMPTCPHVCFMVLEGVLWKRDKTFSVDQDGGNMIILRGSDIGNLIPHVPLPPMPNIVLLPLIIGFSGSKSYFGAAKHTANGKVIACALLSPININGNCWDPGGVGTIVISGIVPTWNTVVVTMTWGDILGGFITMFIDSLCAAVLSFVAGKAAGRVSGPIVQRIMGSRVGSYLVGKATEVAAREVVKSVVDGTLGGVILFVTGSPLGYSLPFMVDRENNDAGSLGNLVGYDLGNWMTGDTPSDGSVQGVVGTTDGNVPSPAEQQARSEALQQPAPARPPAPGEPGGDLSNQPVERWG